MGLAYSIVRKQIQAVWVGNTQYRLHDIYQIKQGSYRGTKGHIVKFRTDVDQVLYATIEFRNPINHLLRQRMEVMLSAEPKQSGRPSAFIGESKRNLKLLLL